MEERKDIIQLLPDPVANQIAAGEVIQRPASVVKELMENAVDAGADHIQLIVKDAGKTLILVKDNGCGMSETDARLCFEHHATSKIRSAEDLFSIRTFGFRGEAMSSIAAVGRVELQSRRAEDQLATKICIEASRVVSQQSCAHPAGTSVAVRNIFFNIPARRRFLKSDQAEMRHIILAFQRIALANHEISFSLHHNDVETFRLKSGNFRKRITDIFGRNCNEKLVPVDVSSSILKLSGYVGKPEKAKKTRGEQFFFVNKRFIKHPYLHHAVLNAFDGLIGKDVFPSYFLNLEVDTHTVDVNIHPTKTEVKFENEKELYAIIRSAVKQSLGKFNIVPTIDFDKDPAFDIPHASGAVKIPEVRINPRYNPFDKGKAASGSGNPLPLQGGGWEKLYSEEYQTEQAKTRVIELPWSADEEEKTEPTQIIYQLHNKYVLTNVHSGFMIIHQQRAHARILYERFLKGLNNSTICQQELFPLTVKLSSSDGALLTQLLDEVNSLGVDIRPMGGDTFVVHGLPANSDAGEPEDMIETILEHYKRNLSDLKLESRESLARAMASNTSIRSGKKLNEAEMRNLIDELLACEIPHTSPNGKAIIYMLTLEDLDRQFN